MMLMVVAMRKIDWKYIYSTLHGNTILKRTRIIAILVSFEITCYLNFYAGDGVPIHEILTNVWSASDA